MATTHIQTMEKDDGKVGLVLFRLCWFVVVSSIKTEWLPNGWARKNGEEQPQYENDAGEHGLASVDEHGPASEEAKRDKGKDADEQEAEAQGEADDLVESDYNQEAEDIAAETFVDPTKFWDTLQVPNIPP
ncbi:hypothetical protein QYF36_010933 [Acer negundo]|nr:hypothetical protein QYF36_010933 [Acer negundo]